MIMDGIELSQNCFKNAPAWVKSCSIDFDGQITWHDCKASELSLGEKCSYSENAIYGNGKEQDSGIRVPIHLFDADAWKTARQDRI